MKMCVWLLIALAITPKGGESSPPMGKKLHNYIEEKDSTRDEQDNLVTRKERNVGQFGAMIACEVKDLRSSVLNGYGCFCGLGGKGKPLDDIDLCCYVHDNCYGDIQRTKICGPDPNAVYYVTYRTQGCSGCRGYHFLWFLGYGNSKCQKKLCECDGVAARCFKSHFSKLQDRYINYDKSKC
ncbi:hypothetical protein pdam_00001918 [Pocillopora damicornis]|uniref:Phospholipase A2 n=1 Tax=Pocillopora damicornis TaxID=46731 RepID=A0A3M6TQA9_POCDA|nr:acidic phospholipase A2 DE-II-like [Pocillopora damicornis]RMX43536.1 hypothetical protein pdam_00001918 [Pocillopora damicornis]